MTPKPQAQLLITLHADRSVQVQGAITDPILAYGLLELGREALRAHFAHPAKPAIEVARPADPFLLTQRPNGHPNRG